MNIAEQLDQIVSRYTAFATFGDLVNAAGGYRPTIRCYDQRVFNEQERAELEILADCYDGYQERRGDARRAYRGSQNAIVAETLFRQRRKRSLMVKNVPNLQIGNE